VLPTEQQPRVPDAENLIRRTDDDGRETQYLVAFGSKHDMRAIPLEQRHAQILLELAHLDTEGWLGNGAAIGCPHPRRMRSQP
jgi:hypothetical protein